MSKIITAVAVTVLLVILQAGFSLKISVDLLVEYYTVEQKSDRVP